MSDIFDNYSSLKPNVHPTIYAYSDNNIKYKGLLKVGYTERTVEKRVNEQYPTNRPDGLKPYKILLEDSAMYADGTHFTDHEVHTALQRAGFKALSDSNGKTTEWFKCTKDDVQAAIISVRNKSDNINHRTYDFKMRPEQESAVEKTIAYYQRETADGNTRTPKFLWNAKMRFGKTFASYQLAKQMGLKKILILTFKPAVQSAWQEDLESHIDFEGWQFISKDGPSSDSLDMNEPIVCFGSFQDFLGMNKDTGGIKARNEWVHEINWDLVIFDEYHFGAWRDNAKGLFENEDEDSYDELDVEEYKKEEAGDAINESFLPITTSYYLYLSGTPFRALNSGEFIEEQIYNWTYSDEQQAKQNWEGPNNPYESLPQMIMMTYQMPKSIERIAKEGEFDEFDLNVFFSAKGKEEKAHFIYEEHVQKWLDLIRGEKIEERTDALKLGSQKPPMPYSDVRLLDALTHTLWFMPNVSSCYAMANLLEKKQNAFFHDYKINVCAGSKAGIGAAALEPVEHSMADGLDKDPLNTKTITLSCGKLTTGVTIKPWSGIFMLRGLSSPETYFQAAFRVQSPWTIKSEDGKIEILKTKCYIFDFALNRALREVSDYSCQLNVNEHNPEAKINEFINFLPVLAYDGSAMRQVNASEILDIAMSGTSATLLARRWQSALLVNVDNDTLKRLMASPEAMKALMSIEDFRSLNEDIPTIINKSEAVKKVKKEKDTLTKKEKKELSEEEKEYKSKRKEIQEKLIKFATRIPIFMYLTDYREFSLKDIISQLEPFLFKKVTGLDVKDFELLVTLGVFNDSVMNEAVYKFKRYEDASLEYTGINRHGKDENVGLFSTVISHADYLRMSGINTQNTNISIETNTLKLSDNLELSSLDSDKRAPSTTPALITLSSKTDASDYPIPTKDKQTSNKEKRGTSVPPKLQIGEKVKHRKYGIGTISGLRRDVCDITFPDGTKTTMGITTSFEKGFLKKA